MMTRPVFVGQRMSAGAFEHDDVSAHVEARGYRATFANTPGHAMLTRRTALGILPLLAASATAARAETRPLASSRDGIAKPLTYYSDYFSFVGRDKDGAIYFGFDNNRGQDGAAHQAEHFLSFYVDGQGWVELKGNGAYPNPKQELKGIPDSAHFSFEGGAESGLSVKSAANDLTLRMGGFPRTLLRQSKGRESWYGAAPATLTWKGRTLEGRAIYEYLYRDRWNRLARRYPSTWKNFNGLYLMTATGADLHIRMSENPDTPVGDRRIGFATWGAPAPVAELAFQVRKQVKAEHNNFSWPDTWSAAFKHAGGAWNLEAETVSRDVIGYFAKGGFAMSVVKGRVESLDRKEGFDVVGLGELLI